MKKEKCLCLLVLLNFLVLCLLCATPCYASWAKLYSKGIDYLNLEYGKSILQTKDGGFIIAGSIWYWPDYQPSNFHAKGWVLKLKPDGSIEWEKAYDSNDSNFIDSNVSNTISIHETSDAGYIVLGQNWLLKLRQNGDAEWLKLYKPEMNVQGGFLSGELTSDSGYIVSGWNRVGGSGKNDFLVLKLDSQGSIVWQKTYGGESEDFASSIQQTPDGGYIVAGSTESFGAGKGDLWVLKLDSDGRVIWGKTYGGSEYDAGYDSISITTTADGGYVVATNTVSVQFGGGNWILKLTSSGSVVWEKSYRQQTPDGWRSCNLQMSANRTADGGCIVTGKIYNLTSIGTSDVCILKLDENGNTMWQKIFGSGSGEDTPYSIQETSEGNIIVTGMTASFNSNGVNCENCGTQILFLNLTKDGEIPGCQYMTDSSYTTFNTNATITETNVTPVDTFALMEAINVSSENTAAKVTTICYAIEAPNISVNPTSLNFGNVTVGSSSAPQTFTVSNTGTADLHISGMSLSDTTNYFLTMQMEAHTIPCGSTTPTIAPNSNCIVTVIFNPLSTGQKDATLTINSDDTDTPILNVPLSGIGVPMVKCNLVPEATTIHRGDSRISGYCY